MIKPQTRKKINHQKGRQKAVILVIDTIPSLKKVGIFIEFTAWCWKIVFPLRLYQTCVFFCFFLFLRNDMHSVKSVRIWSFLYFPVFGLNTEIYRVNHRILAECVKMWTGKNTEFGHFLCSDVGSSLMNLISNKSVSRNICSDSKKKKLFISVLLLTLFNF